MLRFENVKISSTKACTYFEYAEDPNYPSKSRWKTGKTIDNHVKGKFSKGSSKRLSDIIVNWVSVIDATEFRKGYSKPRIGKYMKFLTLTLSATQYMSDLEVRREMLNPLIRDLKKYNNLKTYAYCSEAQKNGNIHFHLIVDKFIPWQDIRKYWNRIQATKCYINIFENSHKHRNPNSIDIHKWNKIKSPVAYLLKYFTKDQNRRKVYGHLWGCSDNLKKLVPYRTDVCSGIAQILNRLVKDQSVFIFKHDFFTLFRCLDFSILFKINSDICDTITQFYSDQFDLIY